MIRRDKKCLLALMAAALLAVQAAGCSAPRDHSGEARVTDQIVESAVLQEELEDALADEPDIEQAAQHMLTVWSDHLDVLEKMYASELWALNYVDAYLESGDWNDLVRARAACIASARYLSELSMTEEDLPEEEYLILAGAGVDTSYQSVEFGMVSFWVEEAHNFIRSQLLEKLQYYIYYENLIEVLKTHTSTERDSISVMCQYTCVSTNYLLLSLGDDTVSKTYWSSMKENYPVLTAGRDEWSSAQAELEAAAARYMDQYEDIVMRVAEVISMAEAEEYQITQVIQNQGLKAQSEFAHTMADMPQLLPFPTWYDPHTFKYLSIITSEDGGVTYPESGDDLGDGQYGICMQAEGVTGEEIAAYMDIAKEYALDAWREQDSGAWYISMPDYNVKIDCEDGMTTILFNGEDVTFAPVWYILK